MDKIFEKAPQIIEQAGKSPLELTAFLILVLSVIGFLFFRNAGERIRLCIYGIMFVSFIVTTQA